MNALSSSCSGSSTNLTAVDSNSENQVHENLIEWRVSERSTEDSLMGTDSEGSLFGRDSSVVKGEQSCPAAFIEADPDSEERANDVEQNVYISEFAEISFLPEDKSSKKFPVEIRKPDSLQGWNFSQAVRNSSYTFNEKDVNAKADYHPELKVLYPCHPKSTSEKILAILYNEDMNFENVNVKHDATSFSDVEDEITMQVCSRRSKSFPPPLASSALKRTYPRLPSQLASKQLHSVRSPGRILLQEVKVAPQLSLFQPIRTQGRLVLHLLHCDA